jgi:hypothetical protein
MDRKIAVKRFFDEGILISPTILDGVSENNIDNVIRTAKERNMKFIGNLSFLSAPSPKTEGIDPSHGIEVILTEPPEKKKLSPKDFADFYKSKYEGIRELLLKKTQAVSISNIKSTFSDATAIGMIKEMNPQGFVLEDPTGEIVVSSKEAGLAENDVVAVTGFVREGRLIESKVLYPDVQLSRKICSIGARIILAPKISEKTTGDHILTTDSSRKPDGKTTVIRSSPAWVEIRKDDEKIRLVHVSVDSEVTPDEATAWLKKRHLPHEKMIRSPENPFLLRDIPDILWVISKSRWTKIYKGVTIISITQNDAAIVNLENKEIEVIDNI